MSANFWPTALAYFGLSIVSAVIPWVNAELVMISAIPLAASPTALAALVLVVSAGQMTGKAAMYWLSRKSARPRSPLAQRAVDRWRARLQQRPRSALAVVFLSALVGFPPFFVVSLAAGALGVEFRRFFAAGAVGRLVHFTVVACIPELLRRAF
jgi:membrane protein YqaA with SNARE-associated domain